MRPKMFIRLERIAGHVGWVALGPPDHAMSRGARAGKGVQKVGNAARGAWKKATPRCRFPQKALGKRSAALITGPDASFLKLPLFCRSGEKRTSGDCRTPSGSVMMHWRAVKRNESPSTS